MYRLPWADDGRKSVHPYPERCAADCALSDDAGRRIHDTDLIRAIRYGVNFDGTSVVGMPSTAFHHLTDRDLAAIIAFLRSRPPGPDGTDAANAFRVFARSGIATGQFTLPAAETQAGIEPLPSLARSDPIILGCYLAMTSCSGCHGVDLQGNLQFPSPSLATVRGYTRTISKSCCARVWPSLTVKSV